METAKAQIPRPIHRLDDALGITERVLQSDFFWTGFIRQRYTDFQVNEIDNNGKVLHLGSIGLPGDSGQPSEKSTNAAFAGENGGQKDESGASKITIPEVTAEDRQILRELLGVEVEENLVALYNSASSDPQGRASKPVTTDPIDDKQKRGQVHQEIRRIFQSNIETNTNPSGAIIASRRKYGGRGGGSRQRRDPGRQNGEYVHFNLYKENRDTLEAVGRLAGALGQKASMIAVSGTKDRRAATVQRCSTRFRNPEALSRANRKLVGIVTGDYEYQQEPLYMGWHTGNEFCITARECVAEITTPAEDLVELFQTRVGTALDQMYNSGWINYFGQQRFGTYAIGTHHVGKLILKGDFEGAVNAVLAYDPDSAAAADDPSSPDDGSKDFLLRSKACKIFLTTGDATEALKHLPRRFNGEQRIISHLSRNPPSSNRDFPGAIGSINRGLRSMYLHAYQSYIWNHAASKRWSLHGNTVVAGDLVIDETKPAASETVDGDTLEDDVVVPTDDDENSRIKVRPLTADEAHSGDYTIFDVFLPMPGFEMTYPTNEIGDFYREMMGREENGALDPHKMRRAHKDFSLPGQYRKFMTKFLAKPEVVSQTYADETEQLHPTDLDILRAKIREQKETNQGQKRALDASALEQPNKKAKVDGDDENIVVRIGDADMKVTVHEATPPTGDAVAPTGKGVDQAVQEKIALILKFQLGKSAYATIMLRELMGSSPDG